jgi:hypothetical protein
VLTFGDPWLGGQWTGVIHIPGRFKGFINVLKSFRLKKCRFCSLNQSFTKTPGG